MTKQYKAVENGKRMGWLVIEYYKRPGFGDCHTYYWHDIIASSADKAIKFVTEQEQ